MLPLKPKLHASLLKKDVQHHGAHHGAPLSTPLPSMALLNNLFYVLYYYMSL